MEFMRLERALNVRTTGHSSKGNQLKWRNNGYWYKADYMGYESLSEIVVSRLLEKSNLSNFVTYEPVMIQYEEKTFRGCRSRNFLEDGEELVTLDRLFWQFTGKNVTAEIGKMEEVRERILYVTENVMEITGLGDFGNYLTAALELDAIFLNEDRHTNNIAVIYQGEQERYRLCPYFDHGLALFADMKGDYPLGMPIENCRERITAKPFSRDFDEQLDAAEELYGTQLRFRFGEKDIHMELEKLAEAYEEEAIRRVEEILNRQRRKYGYLF